MASSTTESNDYGYVWEGSATGTNPIERIWVKGAEGLDDVAAVAFGIDAKDEVVRDTGVISSGKLTFDYVEGMFNCLCPFGSECSAWKLYIWNRNENLGVRDVEWEAGENIPVSNIVDELNAVKQRAKDHTTNIVRALRVPEAGSDNLFVPPVEVRKGKVLGFDDDGNPAVGNAVEQIREIYEIKDTVAGYVDIAASHAQSAERSAQDAAKSAADAQGFAKEAAEHADRAEAAAEVAQSGLSKIEEAVADGINDIEQAASEAASKIEGDIFDAVDRAEHAAQSAEEDAEKCEELFSKISQIEVKFDNIQCFVCCAAKQVENTRQLIIELLAGAGELNPATEETAGYVYMARDIDDERPNAAVSASLLKSLLADEGGDVKVSSDAALRFLNDEGENAVSMYYTPSSTGGVLQTGSPSSNVALTALTGNYISMHSGTRITLSAGDVSNPSAKLEITPTSATLNGAGTFNGATTFGGEVNVLSGKGVRFRDGEGNTAVSLRFTDSPTGGVLNQGSASTTTAMTWMSGNYMSWFSSEFLRLYSGEDMYSLTAKIEANPNGVILAAGAGDAAKIVIDAGKIQVSGVALTLNVAPTAANHATTKGYVDEKIAELGKAFVSLSQAEYDALPNKDANTLYVITD